MLPKTLILVVLSCAILLANAHPEPQRNSRIRRDTGEKVKAFLEKTKEKVAGFFKNIGNALRSLWNRITGKESAQQQHRIKELEAELEKVQQLSIDDIIANRDKWNQIVVDQEAKIQQIIAQNQLVLEAENRKLRELQGQADRDMDLKISQWDQRVDEVGDRIQKALNN